MSFAITCLIIDILDDLLKKLANTVKVDILCHKSRSNGMTYSNLFIHNQINKPVRNWPGSLCLSVWMMQDRFESQIGFGALGTNGTYEDRMI